ncbi:TetR/AcrR family transcriptional regulator [uncultured Roseovarius sp.]|uniref:TetR/AcrR family transcriptional regulator n=1 Tax=uncultured Roseovarius sp. TaxID=293344 RepID=UPI002611CA3C|nr:TetR/AcrR family transcriptional regulator [uncultured Roseovarius sp.]
MVATQKSAKTDGYHHNDLPKALMDAALDLMVERNGPHFSLRELARTVGVTHPSVYRHFKDKSALLDALMERGFDKLRSYQAEAQGRAPATALDQLNAIGTAYVRFARENAGFFSLMFASFRGANNEVGARNRFNADSLETLFQAIERCQREGILIPGDPGRIAGYLILAPHGLASYTTQGLDFDHASGTSLELPEAETLARLSVIPLLRTPPDADWLSGIFHGAT